MAKRLNLDEVFGTSEPVEVEWQGRVYTLKPLAALTPEEVRQYQALMRDWDEQDASRLGEVVAAALRLLCPALPLETMPFLVQAKALEYYASVVAPSPEEAAEKKAPR